MIARSAAAPLHSCDVGALRIATSHAGVYRHTPRITPLVPQALAADAFVPVPGMEHPLVGTPVKLSCAPHIPKGPAPALGAHTDQVLQRVAGKT